MSDAPIPDSDAAVIETAPADPILEPLLDPVVPDSTPDQKIHPLKPGGVRFEQVYAQSKHAQREFEAEREKRLAAEAKLDALQRVPPSDPEYTWAQLEEFIVQGRITRADAQAHREKVLKRELSRTLKTDLSEEAAATTREHVLSDTIQAYVHAIPAVLDETSADRGRLNEEFDWLASVQGLDQRVLSPTQRKALELTALRNVYGSIDSVRKRNATPVADTQREMPGGTPPRRSANPDQALLDNLSAAQVAHYTKMFRANRYPGGWKEVVAELKYTVPVGRR